jgi:predicted nucleic acid-binding protein
MGSLSLLLADPIYIDANILIYSVERVGPYAVQLAAFWRWVEAQRLAVLTSELTALETLVGPMKAGDLALEARFRLALYSSPELKLHPVTRSILERAAGLRAAYGGLKTPDAIHAATALEAGVSSFITNDVAFQRIAGLQVVTPGDLTAP